MLAMPAASFAATNLTFVTFPNNGGANATVEKGESMDVKVTYDLTNDTDNESLSWEIVGSGLPETCVNVGDRINTGTFTALFPISTVGATEGTFDIRIRSYGVNGAGTDNNCGGTITNSQNFTNRVTITEEANDNGSVANNTGAGVTGSTATPTNAALASLKAQVDALIAQLTGLTTVVATFTPDAVCAQMPADTASLQNFLVGQSLMTAAEVATGPGIYGPKTTRAVAAFKSAHKCR